MACSEYTFVCNNSGVVGMCVQCVCVCVCVISECVKN